MTKTHSPSDLIHWTGPYGGVPPFHATTPDQLYRSLRDVMRRSAAALHRLGQSQSPPDFANTIEALEDIHRPFQRVYSLYNTCRSTVSCPELREVERRVEPEIAAWRDAKFQDQALFGRVCHVYEHRDETELTDEQRRLVEKVHRQFIRSGAELTSDAKSRMSEINQHLARLYTEFQQNLLADEATVTLLREPADVEGLPSWLLRTLENTARQHGASEGWAIANTRSSVVPFLTYSPRSDLRQRVWTSWTRRGDNGNSHDNNRKLSTILALRAERASMLGYESHAHWNLDDTMAKTPSRAMDLMREVWSPARERVQQELGALQQLHGDRQIEPWDYRYLQEQYRKTTFDIDEDALKPYLSMARLRRGMFWMAGRLYGLTFEEVSGLPVPHPDVTTWEVRSKDGSHIGLLYLDPFARPGKRSGAWMSSYRLQESFGEPYTSIVSNNTNFIQGPDGGPTLLSWGDVRTMFHEFGHALHGLLSQVRYPSLSGTQVPRDYVEFPSQVHEAWMSCPELLSRFALHEETGEPIPPDLLDKLQASANFNQGFATVEFLASAIIDMQIHSQDVSDEDPQALEQRLLTELDMPREVIMRHRLPHFAHLFAGDGYAAGYYSYLWADTLTADATEAFHEAGSMYDQGTATRLLEAVLSQGDRLDPELGYRAFRGRDASSAALMRQRGFVA